MFLYQKNKKKLKKNLVYTHKNKKIDKFIDFEIKFFF